MKKECYTPIRKALPNRFESIEQNKKKREKKNFAETSCSYVLLKKNITIKNYTQSKKWQCNHKLNALTHTIKQKKNAEKLNEWPKQKMREKYKTNSNDFRIYNRATELQSARCTQNMYTKAKQKKKVWFFFICVLFLFLVLFFVYRFVTLPLYGQLFCVCVYVYFGKIHSNLFDQPINNTI